MMNPVAFFDTLSLSQRMTDLVEGSSRPELHLFSYASCLLSLYEGQPSADWGYDFISSENGLPFARDIDAAIDDALNLGLVHTHGALIALTADGRGELAGLRDFEENKARERFLGGAADALLVLNPGTVREAFNHDPAISYLRRGKHTDWLLTEPVVERLYENFRQLRSALEYDAKDLTVPLIGWLKYLLQTGRALPDGSHAAN
jgi:hypothetical protein